MRSVVQEDYLGCSVACVAFLCEENYQSAKRKYFRGLGDAGKTGFYCRDIVKALARAGKRCQCKYVKRKRRWKDGTIVFVRRDKKYPKGHYLVKTARGWMDPWINFSVERPLKEKARSGFRKRLPGKAIYSIFPKE